MNELDEIRAKFETLNPIPDGLIYYEKGDYYAIESDEDGWWSESGQSIISAYQGRYCGFKMGLAQAPVVPEWISVKDRLPVVNKITPVIVTVANSDRRWVTVDTFDPFMATHWIHNYCPKNSFRVVAWQYLPEPMKKPLPKIDA